MAKSAPRPTNRTANASEIGFSAPTIKIPPADVIQETDREIDDDRRNKPQ